MYQPVSAYWEIVVLLGGSKEHFINATTDTHVDVRCGVYEMFPLFERYRACPWRASQRAFSFCLPLLKHDVATGHVSCDCDLNTSCVGSSITGATRRDSVCS